MIIVAAVACFCVLQQASRAALPERSISTSRQFIVYGRDPGVRGGICDLAERTKKNALRVLRLSDGWQTPIIVHAQAPQANMPDAPPARLNISQTGFGLKIQLDLTIGADVSAPAVEREVLRAVLLEKMYRDQPDTPPGTPYVEPPNWLLEGTIALAHDNDSAGMSAHLASAIAANAVLPLRVLLSQQPALLDSPSRALYRAYSAAALSMLIDAPGGAMRMQTFIAALASSSNDAVEELTKAFPQLGLKPEEVEKLWTAAVMRFARRGGYRTLGCEETERQLAQILHVEIPGGGAQPAGVYGLDEFPKFLPLPAAPAGLKRLNDDLLLLSGRANPLYRPVIAEYQKISTLIARKKTKRLAERLAELQEVREQIARRVTAIEDYMNWFEATQARATSGAFSEYMRAAEVAAQREPRRRDPISVYLDSLESQLGN